MSSHLYCLIIASCANVLYILVWIFFFFSFGKLCPYQHSACDWLCNYSLLPTITKEIQIKYQSHILGTLRIRVGFRIEGYCFINWYFYNNYLHWTSILWSYWFVLNNNLLFAKSFTLSCQKSIIVILWESTLLSSHLDVLIYVRNRAIFQLIIQTHFVY